MNYKNKYLVSCLVIFFIVAGSLSASALQTSTTVDGLKIYYNDTYGGVVPDENETSGDGQAVVEITSQAGYSFLQFSEDTDADGKPDTPISLISSSDSDGDGKKEYAIDTATYSEVYAVFEPTLTVEAGAGGNVEVYETSTSNHLSTVTEGNLEEFPKSTVTNGEFELSAVAGAGYEFSHWANQAGTELSSSPTYSVALTDPTTIKAVFAAKDLEDYLDLSTLSMSPTANSVVTEMGYHDYVVRPAATTQNIKITVMLEESVTDTEVRDALDLTSTVIELEGVGETGQIPLYSSDGTVNEEDILPVGSNVVTFTMSNEVLRNKLNLNNLDTFEVRIPRVESGYQEAATFRLSQTYNPPIIDVELTEYPELGSLQPGKVYYLHSNTKDSMDDVGDLRIRVIAESEVIKRKYRINQLGIYNITNNLINFESGWATDYSKINYNPEAGSDDYPKSSEQNLGTADYMYLDPSPIQKEVGIAKAEKYGFRIVKLDILNSGVSTEERDNYQRPTYYFVRDPNYPSIQVYKKGDNLPNEKTFGVREVAQPLLEAKIGDSLSGINPDTITAKFIKVPGDEDVSTVIQDLKSSNDPNGEFATEFKLAETNGFLEVINYNSTEQVATMVPYTDLGDGEYVVKLSAADKAGNNSDELGDADSDPSSDKKSFIFSLTINAAGPQFISTSLNDYSNLLNNQQNIIVGKSRLDLGFNIYDAQEVMYAIRYRGIDGTKNGVWKYAAPQEYIKPGWQYIQLDNNQGLANLNWRNQYFTRDLLKVLNTKAATDGIYDLVLVADDTKIEERVFDAISTTGSIEEIDGLENTSSKLDTRRTTISAFQFRVDATGPKVGSIKYIKKTETGEKIIPLEPGVTSFGVFYTGKPVFETTIKDISQVTDDSITVQIGKIRGSIFSYESKEVDGTKKHTIRFMPTIPLKDGVHNVKIIAKDIKGNKDTATFTDLFETRNTAKGIKFNLADKDHRLNINNSSAIEIILPTDVQVNLATLKIKVNGELVVNNGDRIESPTNASRDYTVLFFPSKKEMERILLFARRPLPDGPNNKIIVEVEDAYGNPKGNQINFTVEDYRNGFGFGRLLIN
ncbi:hypothetical protein Halha_2405 [Halobacteroides halobius DSM 5150]|uniref:Bacterial repeat domain-containing protein n=1 Tax=Halobacteroides halobius (strain ATCC 35273 / DSM 5150 / MD-1) TaxID=748449 RepID=L0KD38_HALHC|nr:hypothetical protein [Halobacteroides halobius]AGB42279.1 hypothetical protein Halha_2405 [Halobacteroides halobius DSM 5150]